jgi:hypothetical protein
MKTTKGDGAVKEANEQREPNPARKGGEKQITPQVDRLQSRRKAVKVGQKMHKIGYTPHSVSLLIGPTNRQSLNYPCSFVELRREELQFNVNLLSF